MISLIVAHDPNRVIGFENKMPWYIPGDLAYFKKTTMDKAIVMGRNTFESIGRVLPGRKNIIVSRNLDYKIEGAEVVTDLVEAIEIASAHHEEVMVIGGEQIFRAVLPKADRLYITFIQQSFEGDTYFPPYGDDWVLVETTEDMKTPDGITYAYLVYERKVSE
ncbi:dihydrofolate reductase [Psychrobacillus psychrotolerans]|uniref:Dihydrofolate reductase n=1 Tax=Psychrobacillus psychrotolerans TaxID=126156 RepID=A0A1I5VG44_9BACI|nr:dihydrofolate reductase [Psychrobacillus psychrotolerans]SFQ06465.1 dihydrofolate reductase [Psychrobacillus psychrotolerans]